MRFWWAKAKAFLIHLVISILIIFFFLLIVTKFWYPGPLFKLENVWQALQILIPVDVILGPLLTLILFIPGKKGLKLDLSIIAGLQVAALIYGGALIYKQRPIGYAFVVDRFEVMVASDDYVIDIPMDRFVGGEKSSLLMTYVLPPQTEKERSDFLINGIKIKKHAERHYPVKQYLIDMSHRSIDLNLLDPLDDESKVSLANFKESPLSKDLLLPLQATTFKSAIVAIDKKTGEIKGYLNVSPW